MRHDIYADTEDNSEENILAFIEDGQVEEYKLDLNSPPHDYIIDFQADPEIECTCKCHFSKEKHRSNSRELKTMN
jgi:hypothetical protein